MNILFLTQLDFSSLNESNIYTDLLLEFVENGHHVSVVSPIEKRKNVKTHLMKLNNCSILKLEIGNYQKTSLIEKGISLLTLESLFKKAIKQYFLDIKFDLLIYSTPPITLQRVVSYVKRRDGVRTYLLLKDIFPQNAIDLEMFSKRNPIYWYFRHKERQLYLQSDFIGCMSQANVDYVRKHNQELKDKIIEVCPNSIRIKKYDQINKVDIKRKYNIPLDKTIFIYGGNFGKPQAIEFMIKCLESVKANPNVFFVIIGSGIKRPLIEKFLKETKQSNIVLLNHLGKEEYEELTSSCDVGLIFLDHRFTIPNFPSRFLSYMNASIPTLAVTDKATDIGKIIEENHLGLWCESNRVEEFVENVNRLVDSKLRIELGKNAYNYLKAKYTSYETYKIIMKHFN